MIISRIGLTNWRNFTTLDVPLGPRLVVVGANATGKSNFLDAFRFIRDIAAPAGGGLASAVARRGGFSKVQCLFARNNNPGKVSLTFDVRDGDDSWRYAVELTRERAGRGRPLVMSETVEKNGKTLLARPDRSDAEDPERLTQTALEQVSANVAFRPLAEHFAAIRYTHLVPQIIRESDRIMPVAGDPYGSDLIARMNSSATTTATGRAVLSKIQAALQSAIPQFESLRIEIDDKEKPHLRAGYRHFQPTLDQQDERDLSDGTLRLIGLLWSLAELPQGRLLLLEEPELSLNEQVVRKLPSVLAAAQRGGGDSQVIYTTHSGEILVDEGLQPDEVLLLQPGDDGTTATLLSHIPRDVTEFELGLTIPEIISDRMAPPAPQRLAQF